MKVSTQLPVAAALCWAAVATLYAETKIGFRQLSIVDPVAVQQGTETTLSIHSNFTLDEAYKVFFDKPGIEATFLEEKPIDAPRRGRGRLGKPFRFRFRVPADQEPGVYECRVATRQAVSSVTHVLVTEYPVVQEVPDENGTAETAQSVSVPVAVSGRCNPGEDVDCYRFAGHAGQQIAVQVYAQRVTEAVHSMQCGNSVYLMDALLRLYGPEGRLISENDNFIGGDALITYALPADGQYVLEVRDARYIGDQKYAYCVEITDQPFAHAVFPMAAQQGTTTNVELLGTNLGPEGRSSLALPQDEPAGRRTARFETPLGLTNPLPVLVSEHPQVVVEGAHASPDDALPLSLPVGVNGRLGGSGEVHHFSFAAEKGVFYLFEVIANKHNSPLDGVLEIYNADGKRVAGADDGRQTKDPKLYFNAPADGTYTVALRDLHDRGGERFIYHLRAERSGPDFEVHGEYYYAMLAPGTRAMWFAQVDRLNGFEGPVEIHAEGLPAGVSLTPVTIPPGMHRCGLILSCAPDAKIDASLARVFGKADIPGPDGETREVIRYGRITCELQTQGGGQARWPINTQLVGVTKPLDLTKVDATPDEITLRPGEKAEITVRIERSEGFTDPVTLAMSFMYFNNSFGDQLPPGVSMSKESQARLSGDTLEAKIVLEASAKALPVERLPIAVIARVPITFSITTNFATNPVYLTVPAE